MQSGPSDVESTSLNQRRQARPGGLDAGAAYTVGPSPTSCVILRRLCVGAAILLLAARAIRYLW